MSINSDSLLLNQPIEIQKEILSYLPVEDIVHKVSRVCKVLHKSSQQLLQNDQFWKEATIRKFGKLKVTPKMGTWKNTYIKLSKRPVFYCLYDLAQAVINKKVKNDDIINIETKSNGILRIKSTRFNNSKSPDTIIGELVGDNNDLRGLTVFADCLRVHYSQICKLIIDQ